MDKKRTAVQAIFTILTNGYLKGFVNGSIYQGVSKSVCVPGLSCYSCPGALCSCPVGAYQAVAGSRNFSVPLYIVGFLALVGGVGGRFVCGWLCPFGLFEDLLYKLPIKHKINEVKGDRQLKYIKYFVLFVFVLVLPAFATGEFGQGDPWFCKYICPSGMLMAGLPLAAANKGVRGAIGLLFAWKAAVLAAVVLLSTAIYRPFCRYICPLGAVYGLFNGISLYRHSFDAKLCEGCGSCQSVCKLRIKANEEINCADCIRCGKCLKSCRTGALSGGLRKAENEKEEKNGLHIL